MNAAKINLKTLQDNDGNKWTQTVQLDLDYSRHPLAWTTEEAQEAYCRISYAMKLLEAEQKRIKGVLEEKNAITAYTSPDGFGKLTTAAGRSDMKVENKDGLYEVMGHKAFVELAKFSMTDLNKELGKQTMQSLQADGIISVTTGEMTLRYNQPK